MDKIIVTNGELRQMEKPRTKEYLY